MNKTRGTTGRRRVAKSAATAEVLPGQMTLFGEQRYLDMPLKRGPSPFSLTYSANAGRLELNNLEAPLVWKLALPRGVSKGAVADAFSPLGDRFSHAMLEPFAVAAEQELKAEPPPAAPPSPIANGFAEFGLQLDGDHEYFFSKCGGMVGIVRIKRKDDGSYSASMVKGYVPRVLQPDVVKAGIMPSPGSSALPKSLEAVVPPEYQYWKATGDEARGMRDALAESGFFNDECIKTVDGEMRKVEVRYFLYEPGAAPTNGATKRAKRAMPLTLADKVVKLLPDVGRLGVNPFDAGDDWLEQLDKNDRPGVILMLSAPSTDVSPREIARAVSTLKADWFIDYDDSDASRVALAAVGPIYKVHDAPDRLFCSSFTPAAPELVEWVQPPRMPTRKALKTVQFQGLTVKIDRPKGFVQKGKDDDGNEWSRTYELDYGFIPRTKGGDGEELDVFMGPSGDSSRAFWVTQQKADGSFDEYKLFLGFDSPRDARLAYAAHIPEKFYAGMTEMSVEQLKALLNLEPTVELLKTLVRPTVGFDAPTDAVLRAFDRHMSKVVKAGTAGDERYVLGIVLEPDVVDAQNDTYSAEEVRAAEHVFMEEYRNLGFMHKQMVTGDVKILESYIAPVDFAMGDINVKKGTWLMAVRVLDDGLWRQVKSGGLTGFSIGGSAVRKPA